MGTPYHRHIVSYVHQGRVGVLVEFGVESDFCTKTSEFQDLSRDIALHIAGLNPVDVEGLLNQPFARDHNVTVARVLKDAAERLKENIVVRRFVRWDAESPPDEPPTPPKTPAVAIRFGRR
jgi:elongation factor Ts